MIIQYGCVLVCVYVCAHIQNAGCWTVIKVSRLVCRLLVLSCTKPLWEDLEEFPLGGRLVTYVQSDVGQQFSLGDTQHSLNCQAHKQIRHQCLILS